MIVRLMEEATQETEHKGWCDAELVSNKIVREAKSEDVNTLSAQVDQLNAEIAKLTQEVADLTQAITDLDKSVKEAIAQRTAEKEKNTATIEDAKEAQAAEATSLVQAPMDDAPSTFDEPYKGDQTAAGNVLSFLEVLASDFARLESDTSLAEETAEKEHKTFANDAAVDRAMKAASSRNAGNLIVKRKSELVEVQTDLKATQ